MHRYSLLLNIFLRPHSEIILGCAFMRTDVLFQGRGSLKYFTFRGHLFKETSFFRIITVFLYNRRDSLMEIFCFFIYTGEPQKGRITVILFRER